ncbi:PLP-dependent aminotransferase family protein [candidate division KSB1 bacterium]
MVEFQFSKMSDNLRKSEIRELLKLTRKTGMISFAGGLPDPSLFPYKDIEIASQRALREKGDFALQYAPTEGDPFLREQLAVFMQKQGEEVAADDIQIVSSSQQAIDLLCKIFINPGDPVVVELPAYTGTIQTMRAFQANFWGLGMDYDGIIPESLEKKIDKLAESGKKPKFVYLIPDFQNPSGITLTLDRRKKILDIASKHDILIVEDSPYRELRFKGEILPSLYSMDKEGRVVYLKTFSKIFCPGFRLGWVLGPKPVIEKMIIAKQSTDLCTSAFGQIVTAFYIEAGHLENLVEKAREIYKEKNTVMLDSLDNLMPDIKGLSWSRPEGGMFLWVKLPENMDALELFHKAVEKNVAFVIGSAFHFDGSGKNTLRLNYSYPSVEQIKEGIGRLSELIRDMAK